MKRPLWITVDNVFEGHQGHWADCFFSNATEAAIRYALDNQPNVFPWTENVVYEIRPMTTEELERHPEALAVHQWLIETYGES